MRKFKIVGMSCSACSSRVQNAVSKMNNVSFCAVNLLTNTMEIEGSASDDEIILCVKNAGYGASPYTDNKEKSTSKEILVLKKRFFISLILLLILMYFSMGVGMLSLPLPAFLVKKYTILSLIQILLCSAILILNRKFFINGFSSLLKFSPNMDTLVAIGSSASFLYSFVSFCIVLVSEVFDSLEIAEQYFSNYYFESSAMILVLITFGKLLEAIAKGKTTSSLDKLIDLSPKFANVIRDGKETKLRAEELKVGDIISIYPGESIPTDAVVIDGSSSVNEASLSGESIPKDKNIGDKIYCATINTSGYLKAEVSEVGEDTSLSKIIKMVSDASASKAKIAKIADRVSFYFVPSVMAISLITFIIWLLVGQSIGFSLSRAISVLVISCPCALGLATPVSIMVGTGLSAKYGILFKNAESLEETGKIKTVVFDKTGTLTVGKPVLIDIVPSENSSKDELIKIAYSLESKSEHPISLAISSYCKENNIELLPCSEFSSMAGRGVKAKIIDSFANGGNEKSISELVAISSEHKKLAIKFANEGKTPLFFEYNGKYLGIITVRDVLKDEAKSAIDELKSLGIKTIMLSGDNERTANAIAKECGIDKVYADVFPDEKAEIICNLKKNSKVIMVGDGINDAPSLSSADIGIAIGNGSDIAIDSSDVVLVKSRVDDVPNAIKLSRKVLSNIKLSLFWAFIYNCIGIPLACGVLNNFGILLNPMIAAFAMSLSSVSVVSNALTLNLYTPKKQEKKEKIMEKTISIEGMMCNHCEAHVKDALEALDGVIEATPSHVNNNAKVILSKNVDNAILKKTVENEGYKVTDIQ